MPPKLRGKWALGITPRHFTWILKDKLAICERPGGYGENHRRVRRQEEIIWLREQGFDPVISLIEANHNLHNYEELGVRSLHYPFPALESDQPEYLGSLYGTMQDLLGEQRKVMVHCSELSDRLAGVIGGYLVWSGMVDSSPGGISVMERITSRQLGPQGRGLVALAERLSVEGAHDTSD